MTEILELGAEARRFLWLIALAMARIAPIFQIVPFLGGRHLTTVTRNSFAFSLALFLSPWMRRDDPGGELEFMTIVPLIAKEVALGTIFGFLSSLAFYAASGAGFLVDNQRGLSTAQSTDPLTGEETSPLGSMLLETFIMVFIAAGGLSLFFQAILTTYAFWPPFTFWPDWSGGALKTLLLDNFAWFLTTLVTLAAPMLLVCFLVDLGMGLMNRFASQLNVYFLAMPVKSALVIALMIVYWGGMLRTLNRDALRLPVLWNALSHALGAITL